MECVTELALVALYLSLDNPLAINSRGKGCVHMYVCTDQLYLWIPWRCTVTCIYVQNVLSARVSDRVRGVELVGEGR